jgi:hypothetical protein
MPSLLTGPSAPAFAEFAAKFICTVPLDEADPTTHADRGQLDLWPNECEGKCGV